MPHHSFSTTLKSFEARLAIDEFFQFQLRISLAFSIFNWRQNSVSFDAHLHISCLLGVRRRDEKLEARRHFYHPFLMTSKAKVQRQLPRNNISKEDRKGEPAGEKRERSGNTELPSSSKTVAQPRKKRYVLANPKMYPGLHMSSQQRTSAE